MKTPHTVVAFAAILAGASLFAGQTLADDIDLVPKYDFGPQTDEERLESFTPPPPPEVTYPRIGVTDNEPRLYLDPDVSLGGNVTPNSVEGNVRFPALWPW